MVPVAGRLAALEGRPPADGVEAGLPAGDDDDDDDDDDDEPPHAVSSSTSDPNTAATAQPLLRITSLHSKLHEF
jgi:hypothetical protein